MLLDLARSAVLGELDMLSLDLQHQIVMLRCIVTQNTHPAVAAEGRFLFHMPTCSRLGGLRDFRKLLLEKHILLLTALRVVLANLLRAGELLILLYMELERLLGLELKNRKVLRPL